MLSNYFKIAWRNMMRNKGFSLTNLTGLTIGMTCTTLIFLWVQDELSWDRFHPNHSRIYKLSVNRNFNGTVTTDPSVPFPLADALKASFPEVRAAATDDYGGDVVLASGNTVIKQKGIHVSRDYFGLFHWKFLSGDIQTALADPGNIVLTASAAKALFGTEDALGKMVRTDNSENKKVSAILKDLPDQSSIQFDCLIPFDYSGPYVKQASTDWVNSFTEAYVELAPDADPESVHRKLNALMASRAPGQKADFFLHSMDKWRLYSDFKDGKNTGGMIEYVRLFTLIAVVILIIACVNFMNLYTARSEKRAREVGIRKTLGSERRQLLAQFYSESVLFSLLAFLLSVLFVYLLLPPFNEMVGKKIALDLADPYFWCAALVLVLFTGLVSGSYPALYLSSFQPVKVLKGSFLPGRAAVLPRRVLVVLQFMISIFLISATILVYQQIRHVKNRDLGYNPNNLISIPSSPEADKNADVIRNELLQSGLVASLTRTSSPVTEIWNYTPSPEWAGKPAGSQMIMTAMRCDAGYATTIGTRMVEGRDFANAPYDSNAMLLNKAAVTLMQLKEPLGTDMRYGNRNYTVVGVTDNVVMGSPYAPVMPMMILYEKNQSRFFLLRLKDGVQPQTALARIGSIFQRYNPGYPFEYRFTDEQFNQKFIAENLISKLTNLFAGLAIFLCCLGLSGLTSFTIERRLKEIGIRKVLGASLKQLLLLISREFLWLVFIAFLISIPLVWWLMSNWLRHYEYRIGISGWLFFFSGAGVLILTLLTVSLNALRAGFMNPVRNLRSE